MSILGFAGKGYDILAARIKATSGLQTNCGFLPADSVPGQKGTPMLALEKPVWPPFWSIHQPWPPTILFGQAEAILLRRGGPGQSRQRLAVIPRHPL